ncbi:hypothetical protein HNP37_000508 [Flavobacterium nitrogenifigens]|uniref:CarboxypepD_reg-like domain-containing protein n=2 Tax=Flavobacterium TaxID=237 RepID=A0A7W7IU07_9FLAO|nr:MULTISPECIES: hypothetical protein [Flavobacterium]MBB4800469.1 hypothetical protein [Flavobacterium nitrogenifigens]MBB6385781.1 hypothetical protein [Flavobacterium notoginsengisoli]
MRVKLLTTISIFTYQLSFSQTDKLLHGKVLSQNVPLNKVEVINKTAKTSTRTNEHGEFSILVRPKDSLLFFSKDYFFKRMKISQENIDQNNIIVNMILKPEELDEVLITEIKFPKVSAADENSTVIPRPPISNPGVYSGGIANGADLLAIFSLFRKKDKKIKAIKFKELDFKQLAEATVPLDFFTNDLKINSEEKDLFLQFCDADPQAKELAKRKNLLYTMDFLNTKNKEFKKLSSEIKN